MKRALIFLSGVSALSFAVPALAQHDHAAHQMPAATGCTAEHAIMGHCSMPDAPATAGDHADHGTGTDHSGHMTSGADDHKGHGEKAGHAAHDAADMAEVHGDHAAQNTAIDPNCAPEHAAMGHCTPKVSGPALPQIGTNQPAGDASAPPPPNVWMADAIWGEGAMAHSRHMMMVENGGQKYSFLRLDSEYVNRRGRDGAVWGAEFWYGGDINRVVVKSDGEVALGKGLEEADVQLLYSRAVDAYFNLQAGVRQDLEGDYKRSYATIGFEGLAPYWFEVEGAAFLSDKGDLTAHFEAEYDQRITQKLVLQPAFEVGLSAQNIAEKGKGSGLTDVSAGLRLRYEIVRAFSPYVGVEWGRKLGRTALYARGAGEKVEATSFVFGIRAWF